MKDGKPALEELRKLAKGMVDQLTDQECFWLLEWIKNGLLSRT